MRPIQIIQNGDFSDGLTGWTTNNATATISDSEVTITKGSSSSGGRLSATRATISSSKVYYFKVIAKYGTTNGRAGFFTSSGSSITGGYVTISDSSWTTYDKIASPNGSANLFALFAGTSSSSNGSYAVFKSVFCIDLTAMFGAGNEPTIETCRELFPNDYYPYNLTNDIFGENPVDTLWLRRQIGKDLALPKNYVPFPVLWLDGWYKGPSSVWVDRIGGIEFQGNATFGKNYIEFNGTSDYLYNYSTYTPPGSASATIEVVFETDNTTSAQVVFMPRNGATRPCFYFNPTSGKIWFGAGSTTKRKTYLATIPQNTIVSCSVNNTVAMLNGSTLTASTTDYLGGALNNYNYIGKRRADNSTDAHNFFSGKIYSIRIYDRVLTQAEMMENYYVDKARFKF